MAGKKKNVVVSKGQRAAELNLEESWTHANERMGEAHKTITFLNDLIRLGGSCDSATINTAIQVGLETLDVELQSYVHAVQAADSATVQYGLAFGPEVEEIAVEESTPVVVDMTSPLAKA